MKKASFGLVRTCGGMLCCDDLYLLLMWYVLFLSSAHLQRTIEEEKNARRHHFRELISRAGIAFGTSPHEINKLTRTIEIAFTRFSQEANNCNTIDSAKAVYDRAKAILLD